MQKFSLAELQDLVKNYAISPQGHFGDGALYDFEQIKNFPKSLHYPFEKDGHTYYILPDFALRLSLDDIKKHKNLLAKWMVEAKQFYGKTKPFPNRYTMFAIGRDIISSIISEQDQIDIASRDFWKNSFNNQSNKGVGYFSSFLAKKVELEDIEAFQKTLPTQFFPFLLKEARGFSTRNFKNNIHYYTYTKSIEKAPDYSLGMIPEVFIYRLNNSTSESMRLEVLKSLKKYHFNLIEPYVRFLYDKSKNSKVTELAKEILKENNVYKKEEKLFLSEEQFIRHYHKLEINFFHLKEKAHDNLFVTQTLLATIYYILGHDYTVSRYETRNSVTFEAWSLNPESIKHFKSDVEKYIDFTFNDFLTPELYQTLSVTRRGERISHENKKQFQDDFKSAYRSYLIKNKLEKSLDNKNKEKVKKI